ncbi:glycosyltransferase family 4 protein [Chitinivibrio alkaliphilus]|uniref:GT1_YagM_like family glycosyltransferase n=1 Tax=Chitinivibrio alkaliphilus ACht1 TaxID=1313304 RepID=U7D7K6_9BACT|nr:glycosyltransferase family 4 protein [Chitinivibrio alkaliphilus]ERP31561.1 GT1_YagM_like family glycosyltransferase [Chitinivibrio alkaliphilus ACht1]
MNILVLNWRDKKHPRAGGAEVRLHKIYEDLSQRGHTITLVTSRFPGASPSELLHGIRILRFGNDYDFWIRVFVLLPRLIRQSDAHIVVEDFNKLPFGTPLRTKTPHLIQMHHLWKKSIFHECSFPLALFIYLMEQTLRIVYRKSSFIVVSESTKKELASMGVDPSHIALVHNGCNLTYYTPPREESTAPPYLLWIGRIQKYKGIMDALRAFQLLHTSYPDLHLAIAGDGPYKEVVAEWIADKQLGHRITLHGFVSTEKKRSLYRHARAVLQTSYKEGWGLTVIEANACGTPVIANRAPGLCDSVQDNTTGLLYRFGSWRDLARRVKEYVETPALEAKLRENCRPWAERFSWKQAADETEALLTRKCTP